MSAPAHEFIEEAISSLYNIFDHDETSCIFCTICGREAKPTRETGYDYRRVIHTNWCVVQKMQVWLGSQSSEQEVADSRKHMRDEQVRDILYPLVQTNGTAHCYDRYCRDDEWTYCIFCEEGDTDPHEPTGWKHTQDCLLRKARTLLDEILDEHGWV